MADSNTPLNAFANGQLRQHQFSCYEVVEALFGHCPPPRLMSWSIHQMPAFAPVPCASFGFFNLIFDLSKVLQNAGCRPFAFLFILDQLVDLCGQIILRLEGLSGLSGPLFFRRGFWWCQICCWHLYILDALALVLAGFLGVRGFDLGA